MTLKQELKDLCAEANNNDYYLSGYINGSKLEEIIRKYLNPDYKYFNKHWGRTPNVTKELTKENKIIRSIYAKMIMQELEKPLFISNFIDKNIERKDNV